MTPSPAIAVARHELATMARDGRLRVAAVAVLLLLAAAMASGARYAGDVAHEQSVAGADERARWLDQGTKNPHSAAHYGVYVFKPTSPLALADRGIDPFVGVGVWLEAHKMNPFAYRPAQDGGTVARFGELTAALSLQVLFPLLIVLAGHAAFAGERERGTLRQLLAAGVARRTIARGKALALLAAAGIATLPAAALFGIAVALSGQAVEPLRLLGFATAYVVYLAGWAMLTLAVSALARTARTALVVLFGCWAIGCVVGPRLVTTLVATAWPAPSSVAFQQALVAETGTPHSSGRALALKAQILRAHHVTRSEDLPFDWRGITLQKEEERNFPIFDRHYGALFDVYRTQDRAAQAFGLLVPTLPIAALSAGLAGTDFEHQRRFVFAAEAQRRLIQTRLNRDVYLHDREGTDYRAPAALWRTIPPFAYRAPRLGEVAGRYAFAAAMLAIWAGLCAGLAGWAAGRIRP